MENPSPYREKIIRFYHAHKRMPGYKEIMDLTGFKSKNAVYKLINRLVEEGVVEKDRDGRLAPHKLYGEIRKLGVVEAGFPTPAEEIDLDTISLDSLLIRNPEATYVLTVKGDSMIEAGIHDGDMVIAERTTSPKEGDIVIAEVDGGWTMKYLRHARGQAYLEPANKNYAPIFPEDRLQVAAIVRGVVRKYR